MVSKKKIKKNYSLFLYINFHKTSIEKKLGLRLNENINKQFTWKLGVDKLLENSMRYHTLYKQN